MGRSVVEGSILIGGLDFGTKCGWSVIESCGAGVRVVEFGTWKLPTESQAENGFRMLMYEAELSKYFDRYDLKAVGFEKVMSHRRPGQAIGSMNVLAAHAHGGFKSIFEKEATRRKIPHRGYTVGAVKKAACGFGGRPKRGGGIVPIVPGVRVEKEDVQEALIERFGVKLFKSKDNESDAIAVCVAMGIDLGLTVPYTEYARRRGWID